MHARWRALSGALAFSMAAHGKAGAKIQEEPGWECDPFRDSNSGTARVASHLCRGRASSPYFVRSTAFGASQPQYAGAPSEGSLSGATFGDTKAGGDVRPPSTFPAAAVWHVAALRLLALLACVLCACTVPVAEHARRYGGESRHRGSRPGQRGRHEGARPHERRTVAGARRA